MPGVLTVRVQVLPQNQLGTHRETKLLLFLLFFNECEGRGESQEVGDKGEIEAMLVHLSTTSTAPQTVPSPPRPLLPSCCHSAGSALGCAASAETHRALGNTLSCLSRVNLKAVPASDL